MKKAAFLLAVLACHRPTAESVDASPVTTATTPVVATAALPAIAASNAKTYSIKMKRPPRVGVTSRVSVDDEHVEHTITRIAGQTKDTRKTTKSHIEGATRLLALQSDGQSPLRDEMTVADFWLVRDDGAKTALASPGAILVVERGATKHDARVTLDGRAASKDVLDALDHLTQLTLHKGPSDDDVFGTKTPQPVGAEWPIDADLAEKDLRARDMVIPPGAIRGATKLVAVRAVRGVDCLELDNHMEISALQSMGELPPGSTIKNGRVDVHLHLLLPIDESKSAVESAMDMTISGVFLVPTPKGSVEVELDSTDHKKGVELP